jgi:hypothetical protein
MGRCIGPGGTSPRNPHALAAVTGSRLCAVCPGTRLGGKQVDYWAVGGLQPSGS